MLGIKFLNHNMGYIKYILKYNSKYTINGLKLC